MTGAGDCAGIRRELGVYVLGSISPADRSVVDRHLAWCAACREEVAALAGLPALLRRLPAEAAIQISPGQAAEHGTGLHPPQPPTALLNQVATVRRRRRWRFAAAAAVLTVAAAAGWGMQLRHPAAVVRAAPQQPWAAVIEAFNPATKAGATVEYTAEPWGTSMEVRVTGIPAGTACQVWATGPGERVSAGAWTIASSEARDWYPASASLPATSLQSFQVTAGRKVLVTIPRR